jgi:hypothetical protein
MLRGNLRDLRSDAGEHYADILLSLYQRQLRELHEEQEVDRDEAEAVRIAATAVGAGVPADQAEAEGYDAAAEASKSDWSLGHENGSKNPDEAISNVGGTGNSQGANGAAIAGQVDKSALPISAPRRIRDKDHLRYVASQPCLVCGRSPGHAHHIRFAQPRAMGRKVSDEWTVPLCASHHRALHTVGDEERWWKERQVDPIIHAEQLRQGRWSEATRQPSKLTNPTRSRPRP